jgi:hypothetical protein
VTTTEIRSEPRQPRRLEKQTNTCSKVDGRLLRYYRHSDAVVARLQTKIARTIGTDSIERPPIILSVHTETVDDISGRVRFEHERLA